MDNLDAINAIRVQLGIAPKAVEAEKGIRCLTDDFYWGFPDGADAYKAGWSVLYEIEKTQKHPCTNVLKYWPVLEETPHLKIILIQWMIQKWSSKNRWALAKFTGQKMTENFPERFRYISLELDAEENGLKLQRLRSYLSTLAA